MNDKSLVQVGKNETATAAATAAVTAEIQSCLTIAKSFPRDVDQARTNILNTCKRPGFAPSVCYSKPIGKTQIQGISIRAAEVAANNWGNIKTMVSVLYDDESKRIVNIMSMDLETNASYSSQATIEKIVERKFLKAGQVKIYERQNSNGEMTYGIRPTMDEFDVKVAAIVSKHIRNNILRLIPEDIKEEMIETAKKTIIDKAAKDPQGEIKKIIDSFSELRINPVDLRQYLGHEVSKCSPQEITGLRTIWKTIRDGEASWQDYINESEPVPERPFKESKVKQLKNDLQPKEGESPQSPQTGIEAPEICPEVQEENNIPESQPQDNSPSEEKQVENIKNLYQRLTADQTRESLDIMWPGQNRQRVNIKALKQTERNEFESILRDILYSKNKEPESNPVLGAIEKAWYGQDCDGLSVTFKTEIRNRLRMQGITFNEPKDLDGKDLESLYSEIENQGGFEDNPPF